MSSAAGTADVETMDKEELRKLKLNKQEKRMTKILSKAWSLEHAEPFQEVTIDSTDSDSLDLSTIGQKLDNGEYPLGRKGWETFAAHLGFVYNQFIVLSSR